MIEAARAGESVLLVAPTGGGKTLAGFLPSLLELAAAPMQGLHTIYVSPLKALATDIARNLTRPAAEMRLPITIETRTGDTPSNRRARQKEAPPNLLLTTPESLAVLLSLPDAPKFFATLRCIVMDEAHALAGTKRGDQLALGVARLRTLAPGLRQVGLSATVAHPVAIQAYVGASRRIDVADGAPPELVMTLPAGRLSWSGHMGLEAAPEVMQCICAAGLTIVFVNTRAQAELMFQALWKLNEATLPIALHHGSLEVEQRRRVETAMADGRLRAVVATSSLDLGIDWGGVDQVIQVGAPKGVSRLLQRVGRANHRMDEASRAVLVPANRFEVLECEAAMLGIAARELDGDPPRPGGLDVLAQHLLGLACSEPFLPDEVFAEVQSAAPYADMTRETFDDVLRFVEDGGYALAAYDRWRKLFRDSEGRVHVRSARIAAQHRMNIGTIVEAPVLKVRLVGKKRFRPGAGGDRGVFRQPAPTRRHVHVRRAAVAVPAPARDVGGMQRGRSGRADGPGLCRRTAAADHQSCRPRQGPAAGPGALGRVSRSGARLVYGCNAKRRECRARATCWWKLSRAPADGTWSPTASRAATRTRRWACC